MAVASPTQDDRQQYYEELEGLQMGPLWAILRSTLTREPQRREVPFLWPWSVVRPQLLRAGKLVTAAEAERRVLMFLNPGNPARIGATATLYAAMQLILPGECARAHRHTPAALRFIVEGEGAFTCVNEEKVTMSPRDLVLTPPMVWHDHGNDGGQPVMWLDGLDIPLLLSLNGVFFEEYDGEAQPSSMPPARSERLYGRGLFPGGSAAGPAQSYSPVWTYRWVDAREALDCLRRSSEPDPFDGFILRYVNPSSGGEVLATIGCRLQLIPKGIHTRAHRHSTSCVYHVAEGSGFSVVNGVRLDWRHGDTFAVPIWCWHEHAADAEDAVLFSFSDEPVIGALGHRREQAYLGNGGFQAVESVFGAK
ncbi:MAG: cupin domain-containing protein [Acidobacteriales bacterium]|nr:cupin domain-containing protein [Terriglobales bacterium]